MEVFNYDFGNWLFGYSAQFRDCKRVDLWLGGHLGIDYYQGGAKLSDKITVTLKDGKEDTSSKRSAEKQSTEISAFAGALIFTFGFGF